MRIIELYGRWLLPTSLKEIRELEEANDDSEIEQDTENDFLWMRMVQDHFDEFRDVYEKLGQITNNFKIPIVGININDVAAIIDRAEYLSSHALTELYGLRNNPPYNAWYNRAMIMKTYIDKFNSY